MTTWTWQFVSITDVSKYNSGIFLPFNGKLLEVSDLNKSIMSIYFVRSSWLNQFNFSDTSQGVKFLQKTSVAEFNRATAPINSIKENSTSSKILLY